MSSEFFYDLSASDTQLEPSTQKERTAIALSLGYDGVAFPHQAETKLTATDKCKIRPLELEELLAATRGLRSAPQQSPNALQHGNPYKAIQLTRLTIPISDTNAAQEAFANSNILNSYDLLAVQPLSERAFAFACTSLDIDIISLDLTKRLSFRFKTELVKTALQRGVHFEIFYSPLIRELGSRRQIFANAQALARETRGRGIIMSSGARSAIELRGPYDVVNLATFLGLTEAQAYAAVGKNGCSVIEHARKRKAYRGVLSIRPFKAGTDDGLLEANTGEAMETDGRPLTFSGSIHVS